MSDDRNEPFRPPSIEELVSSTEYSEWVEALSRPLATTLIRSAVAEAVEALGPQGFILSPVDNVRDASGAVWERVLAMIEAWKLLR